MSSRAPAGSGSDARWSTHASRGRANSATASSPWWTNEALVSARRIYQAAGFRLVSEVGDDLFCYYLVGQTWTLDLA